MADRLSGDEMFILKQALIISLFLTLPQLRVAKTELLETYPVQQHPAYGQMVNRLKTFVAHKGKQRRNHFYIAEIRKERETNVLGDSLIRNHTYAYWVENDAIIILNFPLAGYDELERKCYIDLRKQVVPKGRYVNLGCCLVEDDWARGIINSCRMGKKVRLTRAT